MLSEAVGTMIIVALVGSHLAMWVRCRRNAASVSPGDETAVESD